MIIPLWIEIDNPTPKRQTGQMNEFHKKWKYVPPEGWQAVWSIYEAFSFKKNLSAHIGLLCQQQKTTFVAVSAPTRAANESPIHSRSPDSPISWTSQKLANTATETGKR